MTVITSNTNPKDRTNLVLGPHGFTEAFDDHTVDLLCRLGLVSKHQTTSSAEWETTIYRATGLPMHKDYE